MGWETLIALILKEGLPVALSLYEKWSAGKEPTPADYAELRQLSQQTALDRAKKILADKGIAEESPLGQQILTAVNH